jgi:hypothetical protein
MVQALAREAGRCAAVRTGRPWCRAWCRRLLYRAILYSVLVIVWRLYGEPYYTRALRRRKGSAQDGHGVEHGVVAEGRRVHRLRRQDLQEPVDGHLRRGRYSAMYNVAALSRRPVYFMWFSGTPSETYRAA